MYPARKSAVGVPALEAGDQHVQKGLQAKIAVEKDETMNVMTHETRLDSSNRILRIITVPYLL
jgi:hypothetical protein